MLIPIITYTNSKCKDIWPIYIDLLHKFYGDTPHAMLTDENLFIPNINVCIYKKDDPFYDIWLKFLPTYFSEFFLYMQEDFFLYKSIDQNLFDFYLNLMKENTNISCIRLLKSGINSNVPIENVSTLYVVDYNQDYAFSMQPTIWRTKDFLRIQETKIQVSPWDECKIDKNILIKLDLSSLYHYNGETKRGMAHYDSNVFPYIATALVKGKWNTKEYPELEPLLKRYNIDSSIRGKYE